MSSRLLNAFCLSLCALGLMVGGCSDSSDSETPQQDASTGQDAPSDVTQQPDSEAGSEASTPDSSGPCDPKGIWEVTYSGDGTTCGPPLGDVIHIEEADGGLSVRFEIANPTDMCTPDSGTSEVIPAQNLVVSDDGCQIAASWNASWCYSGEHQCHSRQISLTLNGDSATGTLVWKQCWICGGTSGEQHTYPASASRRP